MVGHESLRAGFYGEARRRLELRRRPRKSVQLHQVILDGQRRRACFDQGGYALQDAHRIVRPGRDDAQFLIERGKLPLLHGRDVLLLADSRAAKDR